VRFRAGDALRVPFGYVARRHVRAVETNTIFHVAPGALALTFGMLGCDLQCPYCHNWRLSQAMRDPEAGVPPIETSPDALVKDALEAGARAICAAYNEPMVAAEWARAVFAAAKPAGLVTAMVSDGHTTPEALAYMRPVTDVFRVDLKAYDEAQYRALGGRLQPVMDAIREAKRLGFWVEVVTLVVPGFNDDERELRKLADALVEIDPFMPWHLNAFQPRYRMTDRPRMGEGKLMSIAGAAYARGLRFVYVGNVEGGAFATTFCPECHEILVRRRDFSCAANVVRDGACPACGFAVPGLWI
jgi:pyruvate formate lyase activating enzyme